MDAHWPRWVRFLLGRRSGPSDFSLADLIDFVRSFAEVVTAGSHKLAFAAISTTYDMSLGISLSDLGGSGLKFLKRSSHSSATKVSKPAKRSRLIHTEDLAQYVAYWTLQASNCDLPIESLSLKVISLLRANAALRSVDLATMPAGEGAGFRLVDGGVQVRSYLTKTSKSKMDQERLGWSAWSTLTELDPQRVSRLWSAVGLPIANPEKACVARALRVWIARMLPVWSEHGAGFAGISCLARSCFTHKAMVQSGRLMLASVDLIAAQIRNFHNDLHRNPVPGVPPLLRQMGTKIDGSNLSAGFLRHCVVSRLLYLDQVEGCLNLTRHTSVSTSRKYYVLPLAPSLQTRLDLLKMQHSALFGELRPCELVLA